MSLEMTDILISGLAITQSLGGQYCKITTKNSSSPKWLAFTPKIEDIDNLNKFRYTVNGEFKVVPMSEESQLFMNIFVIILAVVLIVSMVATAIAFAKTYL